MSHIAGIWVAFFSRYQRYLCGQTCRLRQVVRIPLSLPERVGRPADQESDRCRRSLLLAALGELHKKSGSQHLHGAVAYCAQQAWILAGTLRDNVCFGRPYVAAKFWRAIDCSGLRKDLELFPAGEFTEIGERGIFNSSLWVACSDGLRNVRADRETRVGARSRGSCRCASA